MNVQQPFIVLAGLTQLFGGYRNTIKLLQKADAWKTGFVGLWKTVRGLSQMQHKFRRCNPDYVYSKKEREVEILNHSADDQLIAINLTEVCQRAETLRYRVALAKDLKRLLHNSVKYKFQEVKPVKSKITGKTKHCWVFARPQESDEAMGKP